MWISCVMTLQITDNVKLKLAMLTARWGYYNDVGEGLDRIGAVMAVLLCSLIEDRDITKVDWL